MDPFLRKLHDRPINGKYVLIKKLGKGGFGVVYRAKDVETNQEVALKLEDLSTDPSFLEDEALKYDTFQGTIGFPDVYWFGCHDEFRVLALELLGPSLEDVFAYCGCIFSLKTTLMIADQMLDRLEQLYDARLIHRDIKPSNFLLGTGANGNTIYVTDFGLAYEVSPWREGDDENLPRPRLVGTARFASIRGHQGRVQSPKDDLESLGYMMVFFLLGRLPWQGLNVRGKEERNRAVMEKKMTTSAHQLCETLPVEFAQYVQEVKAFSDGERPDYERLRRQFRLLAAKEGIRYDNVYDWTIRHYFETGQAGDTSEPSPESYG